MSRNGFTLIELLIVVVIIGLLRPSPSRVLQHEGKGLRRLDEVRSRNLATAEEAFFYDSAKYTNTSR